MREKLTHYIRAGYAGIYLVSHEEQRVEAELKAIAASVAGGLIASYQIGYGLAAFGVGPLESRLGWSLGTIYGGTTGVALALAALAVLIARRRDPIPTSTITHQGDEP